jgi:hypothetical protein
MLGVMITPEQSRAARGLLDWNQQDLAKQAGVGVVTTHQLEQIPIEFTHNLRA